MATITTRAGKGSPLTNTEVDANFTNLNSDKLELTSLAFSAANPASGSGDVTYNNVTGTFTYTPPDLSPYLTTVTFGDLTSTPTTLGGYGITDAATSAQGALANSAVQPGDDADTLASGDATDGQVLTADGSGNAAWEDSVGGIAFTRKTAAYTLSASEGIIADTTGGVFTVTLPATPAEGDTVYISDGGDWSTNNLTVARNGSTIDGLAEDFVMDVGDVAVQFVYDGATWQVYPMGAGTGPAGADGINSTVTVGTTAPASPSTGDFWADTN